MVNKWTCKWSGNVGLHCRVVNSKAITKWRMYLFPFTGIKLPLEMHLRLNKTCESMNKSNFNVSVSS